MSDLSIAVADDRRRVQIDRAMIYAVLAAGIAAAMTVSETFWFTTPLLGVGLMWASRRVAPVVLDQGEPGPSEMPARLELAIHEAVAQLPTGDARRLLGDVVRQARPLFGRGTTSSNFTAQKDNDARTQAAELVLAACDTALELARLDTLIESGARARGSKAPTHDAELTTRYSAAREMFSARLTDTATALGQLYASGVEHGTPASDMVAELATDLTADAAARSAAKTEMDELLK
jgi:hypothetical protein